MAEPGHEFLGGRAGGRGERAASVAEIVEVGAGSGGRRLRRRADHAALAAAVHVHRSSDGKLAVDEVTARMPSSTEAEAWNLPSGIPLLFCRRLPTIAPTRSSRFPTPGTPMTGPSSGSSPRSSRGPALRRSERSSESMSPLTPTDETYLRMAIELSRRALEDQGKTPFGAIPRPRRRGSQRGHQQRYRASGPVRAR